MDSHFFDTQRMSDEELNKKIQTAMQAAGVSGREEDIDKIRRTVRSMSADEMKKMISSVDPHTIQRLKDVLFIKKDGEHHG